MGEHATVRSAHSPGRAGGSAVIGGAHGTDTLHASSRGLLFDVLNRELAAGRLHHLEAV